MTTSDCVRPQLIQDSTVNVFKKNVCITLTTEEQARCHAGDIARDARLYDSGGATVSSAEKGAGYRRALGASTRPTLLHAAHDTKPNARNTVDTQIACRLA